MSSQNFVGDVEAGYVGFTMKFQDFFYELGTAVRSGLEIFFLIYITFIHKLMAPKMFEEFEIVNGFPKPNGN